MLEFWLPRVGSAKFFGLSTGPLPRIHQKCKLNSITDPNICLKYFQAFKTFTFQSQMD